MVSLSVARESADPLHPFSSSAATWQKWLGAGDQCSLKPWDRPHEMELAKEAMLICPHGKLGAWAPYFPLRTRTHCSQRSFQIPVMQNIWMVHRIFTIFKLSETLNIWAEPWQTKDILGTCYVCCTAERFVVYMTSKSCKWSISVLSFSAIDHPTIVAFSFAIKRWLIHEHFCSCVAKAKQAPLDATGSDWGDWKERWVISQHT